ANITGKCFATNDKVSSTPSSKCTGWLSISFPIDKILSYNSLDKYPLAISLADSIIDNTYPLMPYPYKGKFLICVLYSFWDILCLDKKSPIKVMNRFSASSK